MSWLPLWDANGRVKLLGVLVPVTTGLDKDPVTGPLNRGVHIGPYQRLKLKQWSQR